MDKTDLIWLLVVFLLVISVDFGSHTFSMTGEDIDDAFSDCRFVKEHNVCDEYTQCVYDYVRDASCIKGYKIIDTPDTIDTTYEPEKIGSGGDSGGQ